MPKQNEVKDKITAKKKLDFKLNAKQSEKLIASLAGLETYLKGILPVYIQASEAARQELLSHSPVLKQVIALLEASGIKL